MPGRATKAEPSDSSWIAVGEHCLTDCMYGSEEAAITQYGPARQRVGVFVYDPAHEDLGWQFDDVPVAHVTPYTEASTQFVLDEAVAAARELVFQGMSEDDSEHAISFFVEALERNKMNWFAAQECARRYERLENWQSAAAFYRRALSSPPGCVWPSIHFQLGWCLGKLKKFADEAEAYRACLLLDPDWPFARNNLGWSLQKAGLHAAAVPVFQEAVRRGNDGKYPLRNLPKALVKAGRLEEAATLLRQDVRGGKITKASERLLEKIQGLKDGVDAPSLRNSAADVDDLEVDAAAPSKPSGSGTQPGVALHKEKHLEEEIVETMRRGLQVFDRSLRLYESPDGVSGQQFAIPRVGIVDLLAVDQTSGDFVVIELKRGLGDDEVVGQVSRYIGWVRESLAKPKQKVLGIVCVRESSERLRLAAAATNLEVRTYGLSFNRV